MVLAFPLGGLVLGAVGLNVLGVGVGFVVMGLRRSFHEKVRLPDGAGGAVLTALGVFGFVAKGVALGVVGVLLVIAAVTAVALVIVAGLGVLVYRAMQPAGPVASPEGVALRSFVDD